MDKLEKLYENIENNRNILEDSIKDLKSKIKDLSEHALGGQVLARYLDVLVKINDQLIELEKIKIKSNKEKTNNKDVSSIAKEELESESLIGTSIKN